MTIKYVLLNLFINFGFVFSASTETSIKAYFEETILYYFYKFLIYETLFIAKEFFNIISMFSFC